MGINIGLDIGAISLKLAALGKPQDRAVLEALCAAQPEFRLTELDGAPLVLSDYRRIAGSPIQSTYDLLQEFYETVPEDRVEGIRVTGSGSRTIAKVLGLFFENEFKAIARMHGRVLPAGAHGVRNRRRKLEVHPPGGRQHRGLRPLGRMRGGHRVVPRPAGAAHAVFGGRSGRLVCRRPVARRGSPGAARCSPRAT